MTTMSVKTDLFMSSITKKTFYMVKQNLNVIFKKDFFSKAAKKYDDTKKTVVQHIDNTWCLDLLGMIDYGIKKNKS